jgi:hypothetical protein
MRKEDFNKAYLYTNLEFWKKEHDFGTFHLLLKYIEDYQQDNSNGIYISKLEGSTKVPAFLKKLFPESYFQQKEKIFNFLDKEGFLYSEGTHPVLKKYRIENTLIVLEGTEQEENVYNKTKKGFQLDQRRSEKKKAVSYRHKKRRLL